MNSYTCRLLGHHSRMHGLSLPVLAHLQQVQKLGGSLVVRQLEASFAGL